MYKSLLIAVTAFTSIIFAQSIPACATSCITTLPAECNGDPKCICNDQSWLAGVSCCVSTSCSGDDQQAALDYARNFCTPVGATNLPTAASCANSTSSATGTANISSTSGGTTSALASAVSSGSSVASAGVTSSAASSASAATSAVATSSAFGNQNVPGSVGGVLGAIFGALALL